MSDDIHPDEQSNYETFRECLSDPVLRILARPIEGTKSRKRRKGRLSSVRNHSKDKTSIEPVSTVQSTDLNDGSDAEDLGEFIDYLSSLIFPSLPETLRTLSYAKWKDSARLQDEYSTPVTASTTTNLLSTISPIAIENLSSYSLLPPEPDATDLHNFFHSILDAYITSTTSPPPIWTTTRTTECELCHRDWIPLTYHHLIPRSTHDRVRKRGWHAEEMLNSVAWLCRACHSFVHRAASNEELAREFWSVELLEEREDVRAWVKWVGRVRWRKR
ncbi:hypothetical protein BU24DRAFT_344372 [Aaosphaeria arxii CBS 175.79]|uniref:HNH domain-containing protein n=1 Tax=Aaosphaeria arxii CBS 175.79 TaxID=1450172 RepID=A0A6A5XYH9_9PLEO|nr:uncharacterized protein BU24DRAFT_344372 [Aaosphaeria arxii CBS 175.79]KAF2018365.1 hypothetical protein BU24DRAFT_344372 [Aaosphaeria arxii CBS 175.79]